MLHIVKTAQQDVGPPPAFCSAFWFAAYTNANHEKRVAEQLAWRSIEHFLPLYSTTRRWKDRRVALDLPLFPGYIFVRLALRDRLQVLQTPGVASIVGFGGIPLALPQQEIDALRKGVSRGLRAEPHPYLAVGRRVRILAGPLAGMEGILVRKKNHDRFVLSLDLIQRCVAVDIEGTDFAVEK